MSIAIESATKLFGHRSVLQDVNLRIHEGEKVAIAGPSGSGKTTLLSIVGLLARPTSGVVRIDNTPVPSSEIGRHRLRAVMFGWVMQTTNTMSRRTALENVELPLLIAGIDRREARPIALEMLEKVGLGGFASQRTGQLSGGEVQRVCIARALVCKPRYVLADEPTGQLDETTSEEIVSVLTGSLDSTGSALVVASHDPAVALACDRRVVIKDGRITEQ